MPLGKFPFISCEILGELGAVRQSKSPLAKGHIRPERAHHANVMVPERLRHCLDFFQAFDIFGRHNPSINYVYP